VDPTLPFHNAFNICHSDTLFTPVLETSTVLIVPVKIDNPVSSCKQAVYLLLSISLFS
jgi:hypothetical protein